MHEQLFTHVELPQEKVMLTPDSRVVLLGSCFAQNVGEQLKQHLEFPQTDKPIVEVNPFGVLYNPFSISNAINLLLDNKPLDKYVFLGRDNIWHSWMHSTSFSAATREECLEKISARRKTASEMLLGSDMLVVTFGTTRCYKLSDGQVVANCHKELATTFNEYEPSMNELETEWERVIQCVFDKNPSIHIVITVSPYRYRKYGFHQSQLQKSRLLLLADHLERKFEKVHYFPSYEIVMDELRDYRFYNADMLHPSAQTVDIIFDRFAKWCFTEEVQNASVENLKAWKRLQHRDITNL